MRLHLYLRGRVWWARGSEHGVKFRRSTRETNKRKAQLIAARWERELSDPETYRAHKATVESAAERWLREITVAMNPETVRFYRTKIGHVVRVLGGVKLAKLTHDKVLAYVEKREAEGAHSHSIHRELTALRLTLKSAQRAREFGRDPKMVLPRYRAGYEPLKDWVTPETIWAAIAHLPNHRGAAVAWCIATASDFSSIFTAQRGDVREKTILVRGSKTSTRTREVPRIRVMEPFLRHALAYAEPEPAKYLFRPWGKMGRDIRRACRRAGVPEFTARTLRRSAATWMVRAGVPYEVAAKFLGHGSTLMLQKVYGQLPPPDAGRLIDERLS
jgi:integrase